MKSVVLFIVAALSLTFTGCTKSSPACAIQKSVSSLASAAVATQLSCKNLDAVKTDIDAQLAKLNLCKDTAQGPVGDLVCAPAVDMLMSGVLATIPASWECSGGKPADQLKTLLLEQCKKAL